MKTPQACRVIKAYGQYGVGDTVSPGPLLRDHLVRIGVVELVKDDALPAVVEVDLESAVTEPTENASLRGRRGPRRERRDA